MTSVTNSVASQEPGTGIIGIISFQNGDEDGGQRRRARARALGVARGPRDTHSPSERHSGVAHAAGGGRKRRRRGTATTALRQDGAHVCGMRTETFSSALSYYRVNCLYAQSESPSSAQSERTRHAHARKVTRDIAALDFLQNIPMRAELLPAMRHHPHAHHQLHHSGGTNATDVDSAIAHDGSHQKLKTDGVSSISSSSDRDVSDAPSETLAGRRLPGLDATIVHVPPLFRYRLTTKFPAASAVVRRWEGQTAQQGLLGSRAYVSSGCGYPIATTTIIKVGRLPQAGVVE